MLTREHHEELWRRLPANAAPPPDLELRRRFLLSHLQPGMRALDVGCGEGQLAAELQRAGAQVLAVDIADEPLRRARARHPQVEFGLIDADGPWALPDSSFDLLWAGEVIEHVYDTAGWFSEARRVLRSGGTLLLSTPAHGVLRMLRLAVSRRAFAEHFEPRGEHLRFYAPSTLAPLLEDFGFEQLELRAAGGFPGARRTLLARAVRSRF